MQRIWEDKYGEDEVRQAVASSVTFSEALRRLGLRPAGSNFVTLRNYCERWDISIAHFDPNAARRRASRARGKPLAEVLVRGSTYSRNHLKRRLYAEGLKQRICELCGQGEIWRGSRMSLVLDHINGEADDHRLANLRIVCPNCAATLDTHCGRNLPRSRTCVRCGVEFEPNSVTHRYCSRACGRGGERRGIPPPVPRRIERPPVRRDERDAGEDDAPRLRVA